MLKRLTTSLVPFSSRTISPTMSQFDSGTSCLKCWWLLVTTPRDSTSRTFWCMGWPCCCGLCPWSFAQYCPSNPLLHRWEWRWLERTTITAVTRPNGIWATNRWSVWKRGYNAQSRATLTSEKVLEEGMDLDTYSSVLHVKCAFSRLLYEASTSRWQYISHHITHIGKDLMEIWKTELIKT